MHYLDTFEDWLSYQQIDGQSLPKDVAGRFRGEYDRVKEAALANDVHSVVRGPRPASEHRYAIAIDDGARLWLTLWVKRSAKGEYFILYPRGPGRENPHASYHLDGRYHQKTNNHKFAVINRQPLNQFKGSEHLGAFGGHGVGAFICDPHAFTSVLTVSTGLLEPQRGYVLVDLVEPGVRPAAHHRNLFGTRIVTEETYRDCSPWLVIAIVEQLPQ